MSVWRLVLFLGAVWAIAVPGMAQQPPARVVYTEVREHSVRQTVELPGTVEARTSSLVASEVDGLVSVLKAREGQAVRKGQVLVRLRTTDLELRLQAAEAGLRVCSPSFFDSGNTAT
jgi:multidrug efflux pump subunit AcrA (membrane-fusion protein)